MLSSACNKIFSKFVGFSRVIPCIDTFSFAFRFLEGVAKLFGQIGFTLYDSAVQQLRISNIANRCKQ